MRVNFRRTVSGNRAVTGFVVGVIATMTIAGGGVAIASIPSSSTAKFTGCVAKTGGALRVIDAQAGKKCKSTEKAISWSKGWTHRGAWASGTAYKPGDVVTAERLVLRRQGQVHRQLAGGERNGVGPARGCRRDGSCGGDGGHRSHGPPGRPGRHGTLGPVTLKWVAGSGVSVASGAAATYFSVACPSDLHAISGGASISGTSSERRDPGELLVRHGTLPGLRLRRDRRGRLGGVHQQHQRFDGDGHAVRRLLERDEHQLAEGPTVSGRSRLGVSAAVSGIAG